MKRTPKDQREAVTLIADAIDSGRLKEGRRLFDVFLRAQPRGQVDQAFGALVFALGDTRSVPRGVIHCGASPLILGNPFRDGYAWRCGTCRPAVGVNYKTCRGALKSAAGHAAEKHANRVTVKGIS